MTEEKKPRKKILGKLLLIIVVLLLCTPLIMWVMWVLTPAKPMNIFILDKTVINRSYQEHLSLSWVLQHNKFVNSDRDFYSPDTGYYGFFPDGEGSYTTTDLDSLSNEELTAIANEYDMAYYTDLYGIYRAEWYNEYPQLNPEQARTRIGERTSLIYGGLKESELDLLKEFKRQKKLIVNEFNIIASPTSYDVRRQYEEEFDVKWSGWTGRYIENLDTTINRELPLWLVNNYMEQNEGDWPFTNSGIAFVSSSDSIVILENKTHLTIEVPFIHTKPTFTSQYGVPDSMKYPFWFDIVSTDSLNQVISNYKIATTELGDSLLQRWNIPEEFPAVLSSVGEYPYFYFAGDYADNPVSMKRSKFKYINTFGFLFYDEEVNERKSFFWEFYQPLMKRILNEYYGTLNN